MELTLRDLIWLSVLIIGQIVAIAGTYFRLKAQADKNCRELAKTRKALFSPEGEMLLCTTKVCKEKRVELKEVIQANQQAADLVGQDVQEIKQLIILIAHELKIDINSNVIHNRRSSDN